VDVGNFPATQPISETYSSLSSFKYTILADDTVESVVGASTPCQEVLLIAADSNANDIYIGGASPALDGTNSPWLSPGESVPVKINNLNLLRIYGKQNDVISGLFVI